MSSETRRVHLSDDYYRGALFDTVEQSWWPAEGVFDVPAEQVARWEEAEQAWVDAQAEMSVLMAARTAERRAAVGGSVPQPPRLRFDQATKKWEAQ